MDSGSHFRFIQFGIIFVLGLLIGLFIRLDTENMHTEDMVEQTPSDTETANPFQVISNQQYAHQLEDEVETLSKRLASLEQKLKEQEQANLDTPESTVIVPPAERLTMENLLKVGVTEVIAEDVIKRVSQHEYLLLELHDRAKREGYLNSSRYFKERRELMANAPTLRDAIGTNAYDRYLYETAQNNRVIVTTVMNESPADQLGVLKGDIIMNYDNNKVLDWRELRELTGKGAYGEYVNLTVLRDGQLINILVPRGPLGVKLGATIIDPQSEYNY